MTNQLLVGGGALPIVLLVLAAGLGSMSLFLDGFGEVLAYPKEQGMGYNHYGGGISDHRLQPGQYASGTIASMQNDENGNPIWIVSGNWKAGMTEKKDEYSGGEGWPSTMGLSTGVNKTSQESSSGSNTTEFVAAFKMAKNNGSSLHEHKIYNFTLNEVSMPDNMTMIFNGTSTVTLKEGPVLNVPTLITVMAGNVISIYAEPSAVNNHFGNTPIYGMVSKAIHVLK